MPITINPLRYPGAKRNLSEYIRQLIIANNLEGCTYFEPYAGSAAVGLALIQKQTIDKLVLCEKDVLIYSFWNSLFTHTEELCERIDKTPISVETWKNQIQYRNISHPDNANIVDVGFAGLFLNRTNFSGILNANPIGGLKQTSAYTIDCRFNKNKIISIIEELAEYRDSVEVYFDDALSFMNSQKGRYLKETCFAYFDPPYYGKGKQLYRQYYNANDHVVLSQFVRRLQHIDWIVSYDNDPFICGLYSERGMIYQPFFLDYTCASGVRSRGEELLISNLPLPPFSLAKTAGL